MKKIKLLTEGKNNTKTAKNSRTTYYLSLQPASFNSKNVNLCKFSTKECREQCLQYAGRQGFSNVVKSRTNKTEYYLNNPQEFIDKLYDELKELNKGKVAVRLNLLSDVDWEKEFAIFKPDVNLNDLKNIQLYDYTKDHFKIMTNGVKNYHFTYSYSGHNWKICSDFLQKGLANVAVVFKPSIPSTYESFTVINGDESDERYLDAKNVIVGLKYKKPKGVAYDNNKFVIEI